MLPGAIHVSVVITTLLLWTSNSAAAAPHQPGQHVLQTGTAPSLAWHNCTELLLSGLQCATLAVPLDYSSTCSSSKSKSPEDCQPERIHLLVTRLPAKGSAEERIGSLIYNPGGPGAPASVGVANFARSNSSVLASSWSYLSDEIRRKFDVIGPDPRGVGFSTPLLCDGTIFNTRVSSRPQTADEFDDLVRHNKALGESCRDTSGRIADLMDTKTAARDIERIRLALQDGPLNYLGFSYGTQLGMAYAEMYPHNIWAMVLDGLLDHAEEETNMFVTESHAFENELNRFFEWCNSTTDCALHGSNAPELFDEMIQRAEHTPIAAPGCVQTCRKAYELILALDGMFLRKDDWPLLSQHLKDAMGNNATAFSEPIWYEGISDIEANSLWAGYGVECQDWYHSSRSVTELKYKNQLGKVIAPHTQGVSQSYDLEVRCLGWPTNLTNPPHWAEIKDTSNPVLIVHSYYDPSTSYVWAINGQKQIANSVMLSRDGDGHTSYSLAGEASMLMDAYLVNLTVPDSNTVVET